MRSRHLQLLLALAGLLLLLWILWIPKALTAPQQEATTGVSLPSSVLASDDSSAPAEEAEDEPLEVADACNTTEFSPGSPRLNVTIIVFAWRRMPSLVRLVKSLQSARYCGHPMPLRVLVDGDPLPEVLSFAHSFEWTHGSKEVIEFDHSLGVRGMWINSTRRDLEDHEHIIPLEDDIEVSPLFYWWLLRAARAYGPFGSPRSVRRTRLVGISLYTPRLNEILYPQVRWLPDKATAANAFALQVPCSWGALYFGGVWKDFIRFYHVRTSVPFFNFTQEANQRGVGKNREPLGDPALVLPRSRSNVWPRSWKRFMVDFMYGRGYAMLYPNMRCAVPPLPRHALLHKWPPLVESRRRASRACGEPSDR